MELSMVALKIQSVNDVVAAYVQSFGYSDAEAQVLTAEIMQNYAEKLNADDLLSSLNEIVYQKIKPLFAHAKNSEKTQNLALFKALFLMHDGAKICPTQLFDDKPLPAQLVEKINFDELKNAPLIKRSQMEAQKIEPIEFWKTLGQLLGLVKKG